MTPPLAWNDPAPGPTRIKICGLTEESHVHAAIEAGAHAIGLVMADRSPRQITPDTAMRLSQVAAGHIATVTLLVNPADVCQVAGQWVQLHGAESVELAESFHRTTPTIKAVAWTDAQELLDWDRCEAVDRLLVDGAHGGGGEPFDHAALTPVRPQIRTPLVVAGGLTPDTVGKVIELLSPWGVDVSSGVESSRGVKDEELIHAFCKAVRDQDAASG
jgi:phosphoribosylanthranilate isomerase